MKKSNQGLRLTIILAMLSAISIICGKYLAIRGGDVMRFSLESMPIIFAGIAFGPVAGALVGLVADLVGCIMVAYTINPLVALGAASIGAISGIVSRLVSKKIYDRRIATAISVGAAHLVGSVIIKTIGLASYYDMPFITLLLWRTLNYILVGAIDAVVVHILLHHKGVRNQLRGLLGGEEK